MFYVYILYSQSADKFYVGSSQDPWTRLIQHNQNEGEKFTGKHRNWELSAVFQAGNTRSQAVLIELFIKKQKSRVLIKKLIDPNFIPDGKLANLVRVPHLRD